MTRTIDDVIAGCKPAAVLPRLPAPVYTGDQTGVATKTMMLAVESMQRHMTNEGWEIALALEHAQYVLAGRGLPYNETNVLRILQQANPQVVVMQDKREWDVAVNDFRDQLARFVGVEHLAARKDVFKLTILKDSQQRPQYHADSASEIGCHAWIVYYHPRIVEHLATYVRPEHLIRTYHSVNPANVLKFSMERREGCLLSGASSAAYPMRQRLYKGWHLIPGCKIVRHPGYHMRGSHTPEFLRALTYYKVSICTSSVYGYALRKIIESTAAGCMVVTDLPEDEVLPEIDDNLIRVPHNCTAEQLGEMMPRLYETYDPARQEHFSHLAKYHYDYKRLGLKLAQDIESLRRTYPSRFPENAKEDQP